MEKEIIKLLNSTKKLKKAVKFTNNCYEIDNDIFCFENRLGDARYPYVVNGKTLWAHQNGKISFNESNYFIIPETIEGETNFLSFFLGIKRDGKYIPFSLFEFNKNILEPRNLRFCVFKKGYVIYVLKYKSIIYSLKIGVLKNKNLAYEILIKNTSKKDQEIYSSTFLNPMMMHSVYSSVETKWFKTIKYNENNFSIETIEDISRFEHLFAKANLKRFIDKECFIENTTSRGSYCDSRTGRIESSRCLVDGKFKEMKNVTNFSDTAICGDIIKINIKGGETVRIGYYLNENNDKSIDSIDDIEMNLNEINKEKEMEFNSVFSKFDFEKDHQYINDKLFSSFLNNVVNQVNYCATTKNSTVLMLGVRDILQALEAQIIYNPRESRNKILEVLSNVNYKNGRLPRQYSTPLNNETSKLIDSREFIDQGLWMFDTIYQYLAYTDDYSILNECVGYIEIFENNRANILPFKDSAFNHLKKIMSYLTSNIDEKTHCLKALYGDWNDALDGLGKVKGKINEFGNGVSIMASFQLYSSLIKFIEIVRKYNNDNEYIEQLIDCRNTILNGIKKNAFVEKNNEFKILHGWGNDESFYVGSFNDLDNNSRDSLTSNAFYIVSSFFVEEDKYINSVFKAYERLDSKYGLKTFEPYFERQFIDVGRIVNLPKGTAENAATYIHATCFAIDSLLILHSEKEAFRQMYKILPISHEFVSSTPFIMPNSYLYNEEIGCDGESMNDWFTGSSSTLFKLMVKNVFGINVKLDSIDIKTAASIPYDKASLSLKICGKNIKILHIYDNTNKRRIILNNKELELKEDKFGFKYSSINKNDLQKNNIIKVIN